MADKVPQNRENHSRLDPAFHVFILPVLFLTVIVSIVVAVKHPGFLHIWIVIFNIALLLLALKARMYSAKVQDRVIRLEERLRLMALLPEAQRPQIAKLREGQLVALRFASDEEVGALVERILAENLKGPDIKKAIRNWRPDYWRV